MPLTLLVPGLLPPPPPGVGAPRLPSIERWLSRADRSRALGVGDDWLLAQWGLGPSAPVAALGWLGETGERSGAWLRADPIHQQVVRHATVLHGDAALRLTREEADAAIAALNRFFAADGLAFHAPRPGHWYVALGGHAAPMTTPLARVSGTNPFGHLPEGKDRAFWRRVFSEAQMLLAQLPFNEERESSGRPTLNGIWLWGGGALPRSLPSPYARVYADAPLARGLALASGPAQSGSVSDSVSDTVSDSVSDTESGCPLAVLPGRLADVGAAPGETLVVLDCLEQPALAGDAEAWAPAAAALDRLWFADLPTAIRRHGQVRLVLPAASDTAVYTLTRAATWRFYRRPRPLADHA